jgi:uncharacterized protein YkwD
VLLKTNVERRKHGLKPFKFHPRLRMMATKHSMQMLLHGFFSHENAYESKYRTLCDRLNDVTDKGFKGFMTVGENIARCSTLKGDDRFEVRIVKGVPHYYDLNGNELSKYNVEEFAQSVVTGWMNSPGHRANILNPDFEYLGCGCAGYREDLGDKASIYYYYLTQNFGGGEIIRQ